MLHKFDNTSPKFTSIRKEWMALLARAPNALLDDIVGPHIAAAQPRWLRRPETGLMMIQARVGGSGERFNLGEVTVTRCALRLGEMDDASPVGVSYVLGRDHRQAQLAAIADALLQDATHHGDLEVRLLEPIRQSLMQKQSTRHARAQTTKVDFFTVAREASSGEEGELS
ncbi:MAG: phosphonate C-P lyase system protein PhnG [Burkholderiaceae bacterium]|nr:phosphonate C-P lyase system protein PhnG [Burkholderiaceae bacterium]